MTSATTRGRPKKKLHADCMAELRKRAGIKSRHMERVYLSREEAEQICQLLPDSH